MATSGSTDFNLTTTDILEEAFGIIGVGQEGENLSSDMVKRGTRTLNLMIKAWQTDVDLFTKKRSTLTAVVATQKYTMGGSGSPDFATRPLRILDMQFRQPAVTDIPMRNLSRQEYFDLSVKGAAGIPTNFYYDPQITTGNLYVWPPLATGNSGTFEFTEVRQLDDFDASTDNADLPQEWLLSLSFNLAELLAFQYGGGTDAITTKAAVLKTEMKMWDEEGGSLYFQPDFEN